VLELVSGQEAPPIHGRQPLAFLRALPGALGGVAAAAGALPSSDWPPTAARTFNRARALISLCTGPNAASPRVGAPCCAANRTPKSCNQGDPVKISGFVLPVPGDRPPVARACWCAVPGRCGAGGLPVLWPADHHPEADLWFGD